MRILLAIGSLRAGGAERVLSTLANAWPRQDRSLAVVTLDAATNDFYKLKVDVRRFELPPLSQSRGLVGAIDHSLVRLRFLRECIVRFAPDAIISFIDTCNVYVLIASLGLNIPVIVSERVDPRHWVIEPRFRVLRRALYPRASALVVQSQAVTSWAQGLVPHRKVHVIPNPVQRFELSGVHRESDTPYVLAAGRLTNQKGFDTLVEAFAGCPSDWRLVIAGEGPERERLTRLVHARRLAERVSMPGIVDLKPYFAGANIFVLSSRFEGFPNVLLEAMASGLPVVSTSCPSGPAEIVRDGFNGLLVPPDNPDALQVAMRRLMTDATLRARLGGEASHVTEQFSVESILSRWDALCVAVAN